MNKNNITSSEEVIEKRYRHFMLLLYTEWSNYDDIIQDIRGNFKNYAYITHKPESEEKKEHTHLILSLDNPRTIESICSRLGLQKNLCQNIKGLRGACRYLIHKDNDEKIQYDLSDVKISNSFKSTFLKSFDDLLSDDEMLENIYTFIDDHKYLKAFEIERDLSKFVCSANYERVFKRYYASLHNYIINIAKG